MDKTDPILPMPREFIPNMTHSSIKQAHSSSDRGARVRRLLNSNFCTGEVVSAAIEASGCTGVDLTPPNAGKVWAPIHTVVWNNQIRLLKVILPLKPDLEIENEYGWTPLYMVSHKGFHRESLMLLEAGADVESFNSPLKPPLHHACWSGSFMSAAVLLAFGARVEESGGKLPHESHHTSCWDGKRNSSDLFVRAMSAEPRTPAACMRRLLEESPELEVEKQLLLLDPSGALLERARAVVMPMEKRRMLQWRRAVEAKRDARMVFQAAACGRPMELARRLRLGKLAGGLEMKGEMKDGAGKTHEVSPLEAAILGGHEDACDELEAAGARCSGRALIRILAKGLSIVG